jgi:hypothetical protein
MKTRITEEEHKKVIDFFVEQQCRIATQSFKETKGLVPFTAILAKHKNEYKAGIIPMPLELLNSAEGKDYFRDVVIEGVKKKMREDDHIILCVNFTSEAWAYQGEIGGDIEDMRENYRKLPRKEILILSFDSKDGTRVITYDINRNMFVNDKGLDETVDVELTKMGDEVSSFGGRFANMFD